MLLVRIVLFFLMSVFGFLSFFSGLILYLIPEGRGSRNIEMFGLSKRDWKDLRAFSSFCVTILVIIHLYLNRKAILQYLKFISKAKNLV